MTRINKTTLPLSSITKLIGNKSAKLSKKDLENFDQITSSKTSKGDKAELEKDISIQIAEYDINNEIDAKKARKLLLTKMINWHFSELNDPNNKLADIINTATTQLEKEPTIRDRINSLIIQLQSNS